MSDIHLVGAPLYEVDQSGRGDGFDVMGGATRCRPLLDPHMVNTLPGRGALTASKEIGVSKSHPAPRIISNRKAFQ